MVSKSIPASLLIGLLLQCAPVLGEPIAPRLAIEKKSDQLLIIGHVSSTAHEAILRATAAQFVDPGQVRFELQLLSPTPPGWALLTDLMLRAIAETQTSNATVSVAGIDIHGITANPDNWSAAIARVSDYLIPGMRLQQDVAVIRTSETLDSLCQRVFIEESRANRVEFEASGSLLSSHSYGPLDALAELATDCPGSTITVTGHTDSTGSEESNVALSLARAQAVVDYLIARGVAADRLSARGAGSAEPIADNADRRSRRKNRRIEFDMKFATTVEH